MNAEQFWARPRILLRWMQSQWCNYSCWYCRQDHSRRQIYKGSSGHWTDNATLLQWMDAFDKHFSDKVLSLTITGGEPFLEIGTRRLLEYLQACNYCDAVNVDTNLSKDIGTPLSKVSITASYHPSETDSQHFFNRVRHVKNAGWKLSTINYVVDDARLKDLWKVAETVERLGLPLNVLPMFGDEDLFNGGQLVQLKRYIGEKDFDNRTGMRTLGKPCLFPGVAYEMRPNGYIKVGCHPERAGSIFDETLPERFVGYTPCPDETCFCIEKYSFLHDVNVDPVPQASFARRIPLRLTTS